MAAAATKTTALAKAPSREMTVQEAAGTMVSTGLFGGAKDPAKAKAQAVTQIMLGRSMGLGPAESMMSIIVTSQGRLSLSANLMARCIERYKDPESGKQKYRYTVLKRDATECEIAVKKRYEDYEGGKAVWKWEDAGPPMKFTMADAKKAGLDSSETYRKYPANMLFARCISNVARTYCPDVFGGAPVYLPDEVPGGVEVDPETLEPKQQPSKSASPKPLPQTPGAVSEAEIVSAYSADRVAELIAEAGADQAALLAHYGKAKLTDLSEEDCKNAISILEARIAAPK